MRLKEIAKIILSKKIMLIVLCASAIGFIIFYVKANTDSRPVHESTVVVSTRQLKRTSIYHYVPTIGILKSSNEVMLTSQVSGIVGAINFRSGDFVKTGTLLVTLKHNAQQAAFRKARAEYEEANDQFERSKQLATDHIIPQADIVKIKSNLKVAKANLDQAKIALSQCFVKAPFSVKLGIRKISLGQYIQPGDKIVKLASVPVNFVDFSVSELVVRWLGDFSELTVFPSDNAHPIKAKIVAIDSSVTKATQSVNVRAKLQMNHEILIPGSFAKVVIDIPYKQNGLVIPDTAVQYQSYGASVYIVHHDRAKLRYIQTSPYHGNQVIVSSGLKSGDKLVVRGQEKLHDGEQVQVQ